VASSTHGRACLQAPPGPRQPGSPALAAASKVTFQQALDKAGYGAITTEILPAPEFYYAEDYHQQYLAKNPRGYCGVGGTGVVCPVGLAVNAAGD